MILKILTLRPFLSNCYLVGSESTGECMIIDPGADPDTVLAQVDALGLRTSLIVATHGHVDHVGAVETIRARTGATFAQHAQERENEFLEKVSRSICEAMGVAFEKPKTPDRLLQDGDIVGVGDLQFEVLHIPGHSPGGIALYGEGVVFTGDTLFQFDVGRTDFPGGSHRKMMEGIVGRLLVLPDETIVYPGHGFQTLIGREREWNPFVQAWNRDD